MAPRLGYTRPFAAKFLVSGPAPPGRVLNYVRRIKTGDYETLERGPGGPTNLDHWTVCFMVGLGLVEPQSPFPYGRVSPAEMLRLTGDGERLVQLLRGCPSTFPDGSSPSVLRSLRRTLERRPRTYEAVCDLILDSPSLTNFRIFLASQPSAQVRHDDAFYREYGEQFGVKDAAFNRVPSVLQMAQVCGLAPLTGTSTTSGVVVHYASRRSRDTRSVRNRVKREVSIRSEEQERLVDDLVDDMGADAPTRVRAVVNTIKRNLGISARLKDLYRGKCQLCGSTFRKRDGSNYSESHHIVSLGMHGADRLSNIVILCANCHRKLHYAEVRHLPVRGEHRYVRINGETVEIRYSPAHRRFLSSGPESSGR